tara:strand:- start:215 stop:526 length:312 start_codon:yes stop_codon:yes gene_type:complete
MKESSVIKLKTCPFCGGVAALNSENRRVGYDEYESNVTLYFASCTKCGARTKTTQKPHLCDFTAHTVQDFRNNPLLRASVEDEFDAYLERIKSIPVNDWNNRL